MKIFVTGATGYLGRYLTAALAREGHRVTGIGSSDCDLTKDGSLKSFRQPFDQIWHLAAWTQAGDFCLQHPAEQWSINQRINTNVLVWWHEVQPQAKLIAMGTSCSYAPGAELVEESYMLGEPVAELYSYAMTKRMLLVGLQAFARQFGHRYLCLIPSTLFGAGYHTESKQLHFIFDLIRKIVRGKLYGEKVSLWGDGEQKRELIYLPDFVRAAIDLSGRVDNEIVNIGSGDERSIRWYAEHVSRLVGFDAGSISYDKDRYTGVRSKQLRIDKLRRLLPGFELTPLEVALSETVQWYEREILSSLGQGLLANDRVSS